MLRIIAAIAAWVAGSYCAAQSPPFTGIFESPGYGYLLRADGKQVATYDLAGTVCVRGQKYSSAAFHAFYGTPQVASDGTLYLERRPSQDRLNRLDRLPSACAKPLRVKDAVRNLDVFAANFQQLYPFFKERAIDWPTEIANARARVQSGNDLFETLAELARRLGDPHVSITAGKKSFDFDPIDAPGTATDGTPWTRRALRASHRDFLQGAESPLTAPAGFAAERRVLFGKTRGGFGYISILAQGGWGAGLTEDVPPAAHVRATANVMNELLAALAETPGLIIDLRANSGGFDAVSLEIAARFADRTHIAWRKRDAAAPPYEVSVIPASDARYAGPIAVLIGPNTVSAGESMAQSLAVLPQARLFGRPTRGAWSDAIPKSLPNGWTFTLSVETAFTPEGRLLEVAGVLPDEATPMPRDASGVELWGRDIAIAEAWLRQTTRKSADR